MRSFAVLIATFVLSISISAQSGRRITPTPTPTPAAVSSDDSATYSESAPQKRRPLAVQPNLRGGQSTAQNRGSSPKTTEAPTTVGDDDVVKVDTNLVTIPVSVFDRHGLYIPNLKKEDFRIFEDGKEQEIEYFGTSDQPFTVVLLIDTSPSTEYAIDEIRDAAIAFVNQLKANDRVMVIEFDGNVHVLTEATSDRPTIFKAIRRADFGSGTALYDAVNFSLSKRLNAVEGRKAIVLFTDGVDTVSMKANYDSTLALAEESEALIFPIYYDTFGTTRNSGGGWGSIVFGPPAAGTTAREYALGREYLRELAEYTGGRVFRPESTPGGLTAAFEGIAEELRRQYQIGYIPSELGTAGQRKRIKVRVDRPNLVLRARDSYIVGAQAKN